MKLWAVIAMVMAGVAGAARAVEPPVGTTFDKSVRPLLVKYCFNCHDADDPRGDVSLDHFKGEHVVEQDPKVWRTVLNQVAEHVMPPKAKAQPTPAERELIVGWLTHRLNNLDLSKLPKDPGRVTIRRLNRAEYNNTIRDLLGVNTRPADTFPADGGGGGGFDNNGDT
ncbi:MAG TPA: DUF1587 domain-containing protein, partial [Tepidisphaeraceae bacterium]|nr:DUF1587 domain-containing protein [Tepidisphaeraceae bacterium]